MKRKRIRQKKTILVSACLLGINCKYNGGNNKIINIEKILNRYRVIMICPEQYGGLKTPREKSEIYGEKVVTLSGKDVTKNFIKGAKKSLRKAKRYRAKMALLKSKSPSCGFSEIYNGTFSGVLIKGNGITAGILMKNGVKIISSDKAETLS